MKLSEKKSLAFVDGLSGLFHPDLVTQKSAGRATEGRSRRTILRDASLDFVEKSIIAAINGLKGENPNSSQIVLVLDGLDLLLASTALDAEAMMDTLSELREVRFVPFYFMSMSEYFHDNLI